MIVLIRKLAANHQGAAAIEYGILVALIALAIAVGLEAIGISLVSLLGEITNATDAGNGN